MSPAAMAAERGRRAAARLVPGRRAAAVLERQAVAYRRQPLVFVSGLFEPLLYLLSLGVGLDRLVGSVEGPGGADLGYAEFVAPAMLAVAAMAGSIFDSTFNFFYKLREGHVFDAMLATPLTPTDVVGGEIGWAVIRAMTYSVAYLATAAALGLVSSPWAVAAVGVAALVGLAFACVGAAATTWARSWSDFGYHLLVLEPLLLLSTTIFPMSAYPSPLPDVVRWTPLYHGVELSRGLFVGVLDWSMIGHVGYLVVMAALGWVVLTRRVARLLTP